MIYVINSASNIRTLFQKGVRNKIKSATLVRRSNDKLLCISVRVVSWSKLGSGGEGFGMIAHQREESKKT